MQGYVPWHFTSSVSRFSFKYKDTSASVSSQFQDKTIQNLPNSQYEFLRNFLIIETVQRNKLCKRQSFGKVFSGLKATATSLKSAFGQILKLKWSTVHDKKEFPYLLSMA